MKFDALCKSALKHVLLIRSGGNNVMSEQNLPQFATTKREGRQILYVSGDWVIATLDHIEFEIDRLFGTFDEINVSKLDAVDTAGALVMSELLAPTAQTSDTIVGEHGSIRALLDQVLSLSGPGEERPEPGHGLVDLLERAGRGFTKAVQHGFETLSFLGLTFVTCLRLLFVEPAKMRWTTFVSVIEESGINAIPIIMFLSFFVGMVVAFIGATTLRTFDLEIYTVELIGYSMLREFGVILAGIVLAGRTNSSITAQIGTMKMRQEVDAMQTLGLSPMDVLVAPRVLAMLFITPLLAFLATVAGIGGGMFVGWLTLDIQPDLFLNRMRDAIPIDQFWIGMSKAPVFGGVVALIACRHGLEVGGSVQSLGEKTTTSVVQAIFAIIVIDALFAVFYMELGI